MEAGSSLQRTPFLSSRYLPRSTRLIRESCYEEHAYRDCRIEASPGIPCIPRSCITIANKRPRPYPPTSSSSFLPSGSGCCLTPSPPLLFSHAYEAHACVIFARKKDPRGPRDLGVVTTRGREEEEGNEAQRRENFVSFIPLHSKAVIYARVEVKRNASERRRERERKRARARQTKKGEGTWRKEEEEEEEGRERGTNVAIIIDTLACKRCLLYV